MWLGDVQMFNRAKRDVQQIAARAKQGTAKEMSLAKNVTSSSAQKLQELSLQFRKQQAEYLRRKCMHAYGTYIGLVWGQCCRQTAYCSPVGLSFDSEPEQCSAVLVELTWALGSEYSVAHV